MKTKRGNGTEHFASFLTGKNSVSRLKKL